MSSDHSAILLTVSNNVTKKNVYRVNYLMQIRIGRILIESKLNLYTILLSESDIDEQIGNFTQCIQNSTWKSTRAAKSFTQVHKYPFEIKALIKKEKSQKKMAAQSIPSS